MVQRKLKRMGLVRLKTVYNQSSYLNLLNHSLCRSWCNIHARTNCGVWSGNVPCSQLFPLCQAESLKVELRKQKSRYDMLAHTVREQQERLHATNALRKKWEGTLYKQCELSPFCRSVVLSDPEIWHNSSEKLS